PRVPVARLGAASVRNGRGDGDPHERRQGADDGAPPQRPGVGSSNPSSVVVELVRIVAITAEASVVPTERISVLTPTAEARCAPGRAGPRVLLMSRGWPTRA